MKYRFHPRLLPTLATLVLAVACIKLGLWQLHKATLKQALQAQLEQRLREAPAALPPASASPEAWRYRRVFVNGSYDTAHQILLDNQIHDEVAGYDVITPLQVDGDSTRVLVDRGWVEAPPDRRQLPAIATPHGMQRLEGILWFPGKFYALQEPAESRGEWQTVWQNLDMTRYGKAVPFPVLPFVIRLDPQSPAGGYVRDWPKPAERIEMHIGYAYQWFGFAIAFVVIYLVVNIKRSES